MNKRFAEAVSFIPIDGWFNKLTLLLIPFFGLIIVLDVGILAWEYGSYSYSCAEGSKPFLVHLYEMLANPVYCVFVLCAWFMISAMEYTHKRRTQITSMGYIRTVLANRWAMYFYMLFFALPTYAMLYLLLLVIKSSVLLNWAQLWDRVQLAYRGQATGVENFLFRGYAAGSIMIVLLIGLKEVLIRW